MLGNSLHLLKVKCPKIDTTLLQNKAKNCFLKRFLGITLDAMIFSRSLGLIYPCLCQHPDPTKVNRSLSDLKMVAPNHRFM